MIERETVDYTHACGAEHFILLGALQITKGLFTKVKISVLCVCESWVVGLVLLFCRNAPTLCVSAVACVVARTACMHVCVCARARTRRSSGLHITRPSYLCTRKHIFAFCMFVVHVYSEYT
jgi:hypothetical protein